jgi:hypothetical protein
MVAECLIYSVIATDPKVLAGQSALSSPRCW